MSTAQQTSAETFKADIVAANTHGKVANDVTAAAADNVAGSLNALFEFGRHLKEEKSPHPVETAKLAISALQQLSNTVASLATACAAIAPVAGLVALPAYALSGLLTVVGTILEFVETGKVVSSEDKIIGRVDALLVTQVGEDRISNLKNAIDVLFRRIGNIQRLRRLILDPPTSPDPSTAPTDDQMRRILFPEDDISEVDVDWGVRDFLTKHACTTDVERARLVAEVAALFVQCAYLFQVYVRQVVALASCLLPRHSLEAEGYCSAAHEELERDAKLLDHLCFGPPGSRQIPTLVFGQIQLLPPQQRVMILCYRRFALEECSLPVRSIGPLVQLRATAVDAATSTVYESLKPGSKRRLLSDDLLLEHDIRQPDCDAGASSTTADTVEPSLDERRNLSFVMVPYAPPEVAPKNVASGRHDASNAPDIAAGSGGDRSSRADSSGGATKHNGNTGGATKHNDDTGDTTKHTTTTSDDDRKAEAHDTGSDAGSDATAAPGAKAPRQPQHYFLLHCNTGGAVFRDGKAVFVHPPSPGEDGTAEKVKGDLLLLDDCGGGNEWSPPTVDHEFPWLRDKIKKKLPRATHFVGLTSKREEKKEFLIRLQVVWRAPDPVLVANRAPESPNHPLKVAPDKVAPYLRELMSQRGKIKLNLGFRYLL